MKPFEYMAPKTLDEAVSILHTNQGRAKVLAGGTDLLVEMKEDILCPEVLVDIKHISHLDHLTYDDEKGLSIGALVTVRRVERSPIVAEKYAGLSQASRELGSIQIRNRATIAGNISRASPSADTIPPLIADGARVVVYGSEGAREIPLEDFFVGPGQTVMTGEEILTEIVVPNPGSKMGKSYIKLGRRQAMELATVGVAVTLNLEGDVCDQVRVALGAVAPTPIRSHKAEELLMGSTLDQETIRAAAVAARDESSPISDVRSSAAYRRQMVGVLTEEAIQQAMGNAR